MLIVLALLVLLFAAFPRGAAGRALHALLVERPARWLSRLSPGRIAFYAALGMAAAALFWLFEAEGIRLFAVAAPDLIIWFTMFDVSVFLDVVILAVVLGARIRIRVAATAVVRGLRPVPSRIRATLRSRARSGRGRSLPRGRNPDDPEPARPGFALA